MDNSIPVAAKKWRLRFLLGLVSINYYVENRRPDLNNVYKHFLDIRVLWWKYNFTFRTEHLYDDLPYTYNYVTKAYGKIDAEGRYIPDKK